MESFGREVPLEQVNRYVRYCQKSGKFTLAVNRGERVAGSPCGSLSGNGYWLVHIGGQQLLAHRVAWFLTYGEWPNCQIDHINGDRCDNRIANLRLCTISQNRWNSKKRQRNSSGHKGVCWDSARGKWMAQLMVHRRHVHLGRYDAIEDAINAYRSAAIKYHGEFARTE